MISKTRHKPLRSRLKRRFISIIFKASILSVAILGLFVLFGIIGFMFKKGFSGLSWELFASQPTPAGSNGGGLKSAFIGSYLMTGLSTLFAFPLGVLSAIYLAEYAPKKWVNSFLLPFQIILGLPSLVMGIIVFEMAVAPFKHFSGWAGIFALSAILFPVTTVSVYSMLRTIPTTLREASLGLGIPKYRMILNIILRNCRAGLLQVLLVGSARLLGETAPLLFTAFNSHFAVTSLSEPMPNLPVTIFNFALSPYENWQNQAWAACFVISVIVLAVNTLCKVFLAQGKTKS